LGEEDLHGSFNWGRSTGGRNPSVQRARAFVLRDGATQQVQPDIPIFVRFRDYAQQMSLKKPFLQTRMAGDTYTLMAEIMSK
jgi:hypothetical protein